MKTPKIYVIGSLRNPNIPIIGNAIRDLGYLVYDDWFAGGPEADDKWQEYEIQRGHTFEQALAGYTAEHICDYDQRHLDESDMGLLVMPAGKSGHLELGYLTGQKKKTYALFTEQPPRYDIMYRLLTGGAFFSVEAMLEGLKGELR